jgi:glycosyltransferase involved in cell wall biosynthesis
MAKKLKVLLAIDSYTPGVDGVINVVKHMYEYFNQNNECKIICPAYPSYEEDKNILRIKSIKFKSKPFPIPLIFCQRGKMRKFINEFKPDIIHIHSPFGIGQFAINYAKRHNIPYLFTLHTKFDQDVIKSLPGILAILRPIVFHGIMKPINECKLVYSPSPAMQIELDKYGYKYGKMAGYFTNHTELLPVKDYLGAINEINATYGIKEDRLVGVLVARILKYKGLQAIIDTMIELKKRQVLITMLIVGDGADLN